jgi:hypothetical protein
VAENPCRDLATKRTVGEKMVENFGQIIYDDNCATVFLLLILEEKKLCVFCFYSDTRFLIINLILHFS